MGAHVTTIGILAHVDAGKTTLSEQILYKAGVLRSAGRVDHQTAMLDYNPIERQRGITIYCEQAQFFYAGQEFFLVDTPGHVDFSPEMERSLAVLDCAILVVSATAGIQAHTRTLWRLLARYKIPVFFFVNKTDAPGADLPTVAAALRQTFSQDICDFTEGLTLPVQEQLAMLEEDALEAYLEGTLAQQQLEATVHRAVLRRACFPLYAGSALQGQGIDALLEGLCRFGQAQYDSQAPLVARAYKIRHDAKGGRVTFLKVCAGTLQAKKDLAGEKIHELKQVLGQKQTPVPQAYAGQLCAVTGLTKVRPGDWITSGGLSRHEGRIRPLVTVKAAIAPEIPIQTALDQLKQLEQEEPTLQVRWNAALQEVHLDTMGEIQLEILAQTIHDRFGWTVQFSQPEVLYRETILNPVVGIGHYEPLKHYAEVHLLLEPGPLGSGITFESRCSTDALALHWQRLIETHVLEKEHVGKLTGAPLTDIRIILLAGRAHEKHTEGGDFRQAVYRAIRQGIMQAEPVLLEPLYQFEAQVHADLAGRVIQDLQRLGSVTAPPQTLEHELCITGRGYVSQLRPYVQEFARLTKGLGSLTVEFDGYGPCPDQDKVAQRLQYDPERDLENPADSVFCSHGAGFGVKWADVARYAHIQL